MPYLPTEHENAVTFADMLRLADMRGKLPGIWWHTPNEGQRSNNQTKKLLKEGMLVGMSDIVVVRDAAFIEIKGYDKNGKRGYMRKEQRAFRDLCEQKGMPHLCSLDPEEMYEFILKGGYVYA